MVCFAIVLLLFFFILPSSSISWSKSNIRIPNAKFERFSRQLFAIGTSAQALLEESHVIIIGNSSLSTEIAKNLALSGVKKISIINLSDSSTISPNFLLTNLTISAYLREMCPSLEIVVSPFEDIAAILAQKPNCCIMCDCSTSKMLLVDDLCRKKRIPFVASRVSGLSGFVFNDFGMNFSLYDTRTNISFNSLRKEIRHPTDLPTTSNSALLLSSLLSIESLMPFSARSGISNYPASLKFFQSVVNSQLISWLSRKSLDKNQIQDPLVMKSCSSILARTLGHRSKSEIERFFKAAFRGFQCPAMVSVVGAWASQEACKAITHENTPVKPWLILESLDSLPPPTSTACIANGDSQSSKKPSRISNIFTKIKSTSKLRHKKPSLELHSKSDDMEPMTAIYGQEIAVKMAQLNPWMVGCGAIGCELLKNLAAMNIGSHHQSSRISITDVDSIEKSNLHRQLLFRLEDIGQSKSRTALKYIKRVKPAINMVADEFRAEKSTEHYFNDSFWNSLDLVCSALDNTDTRSYLDEQCLKYKKVFLDGGTLGLLGSTQIVVPYLTESYGDSSDPPEDSIPVCTIKEFPFKEEHCILWARQLFDELFVHQMKWIIENCYLDHASANGDVSVRILPNASSEEWKHVVPTLNSLMQRIHQHRQDFLCFESLEDDTIVDHLTSVMKEIIGWGCHILRTHFQSNIQEILVRHPADEIDEDGQLFWSQKRIFPQSLPDHFDDENRTLFHSSDMRPWMSHWLHSWSEIILFQVIGPSFFPTLVGHPQCQIWFERAWSHHSDQLAELWIQSALNHSATDDDNHGIPSQWEEGCWWNSSINSKIPLQVLSFQKDQHHLGHLGMISFSSILRAWNYHLSRELSNQTEFEEFYLHVYRIAGAITPALATTTAMVAGYMALEIPKIAALKLDMERRPLLNSTAQIQVNRRPSRKLLNRIWLSWCNGPKYSFRLRDSSLSSSLSSSESYSRSPRFQNHYGNMGDGMHISSLPQPCRQTAAVFPGLGNQEITYSSWDVFELIVHPNRKKNKPIISIEFVELREFIKVVESFFGKKVESLVIDNDFVVNINQFTGIEDLHITIKDAFLKSVHENPATPSSAESKDDDDSDRKHTIDDADDEALSSASTSARLNLVLSNEFVDLSVYCCSGTIVDTLPIIRIYSNDYDN